jgi:hypothetical protein
MRRFATFLFVCLLAAGATAAPAPLPRPWQPRPWLGLGGWDAPVGRGRFDHKGATLTITVANQEDHRGARLLRDVEGDFVVQVRVRGAFHRDVGKHIQVQGAGIVLTDGKSFFRLEQAAFGEAMRSPTDPPGGIFLEVPFREEGSRGYQKQAHYDGCPPLEMPVYLRLERQGDRLAAAFSEDGIRWAPRPIVLWSKDLLGDSWQVDWPRKVKVGLVAHNTFVRGVFKAEFSGFKLTSLKE